MYIDTHAHLYLEQFEDDIDDVIALSLEEGVEHIFLPNVDSSTTEALLDLSDNYQKNLHPMMGVHPCSINENYKTELKKQRIA